MTLYSSPSAATTAIYHLLDEPGSALDVASEERTIDVQKASTKTLVLVTHHHR